MMGARDEIYARLDALGIAYTCVRHPPVRGIEDCKWAEEKLGGMVPKNLFLTPRNQSSYTLCIVRPDATFRTADVSKQLGLSRQSFAPEDALARLLRTYPGAISPMGLVFPEAREVRLAIDMRLRDEPRLLFHPNDNAETLAMSGDDFFGLFLRAVGHEPTYVALQ